MLPLSLGWLLAVGASAPYQAHALPKHMVDHRERRYPLGTEAASHVVFNHADTNSTLAYVKNSGICETTPGVTTYSGYLSVGVDMDMWFWFFAARNNSDTAPLAMWLNGGPGCSSMIGLFQENGPCHFPPGLSSSKPTLNPLSWNNFANMLYIDQPISTGFSYGDNNVTSTVAAAPQVWAFLQAFYASFPEYKSREFGLWTESYGGHYVPEFAAHFQEQNAKIDAGQLNGSATRINLVAVGINNAWIHPETQYRAYIDFALHNNHRRLIDQRQHAAYMREYAEDCLPMISQCNATTGNNRVCHTGSRACFESIELDIESANDFNVYDVRFSANDTNPPDTYKRYLQSPDVLGAIGAKSTYAECPDEPYYKIYNTGDDGRSFLDRLSTVVRSGISVLLWAGDADWICNWMGNLEVANLVSHNGSVQFNKAALKNYTVGGKSYGEFKSAGNLHWLRVFDAGHEVMFYQPEVSLQAFMQIMQKKPLSST